MARRRGEIEVGNLLTISNMVHSFSSACAELARSETKGSDGRQVVTMAKMVLREHKKQLLHLIKEVNAQREGVESNEPA